MGGGAKLSETCFIINLAAGCESEIHDEHILYSI